MYSQASKLGHDISSKKYKNGIHEQKCLFLFAEVNFFLFLFNASKTTFTLSYFVKNDDLFYEVSRTQASWIQSLVSMPFEVIVE